MTKKLFDQIVLFTQQFPFFTGFPSAESYLENEISVLADYAGEVIVIAHEYHGSDWALRMQLPDNVRAFGIKERPFTPQSPDEARKKRHSYVLPPCKPVLYDAWKLKLNKTRISNAIDYLLFADAKTAGLDEWLQQSGEEIGHGKTLLYSFWFNEPVFMMIHLADVIEQRTGNRPVIISRAHGYDCYDYRSEIGYLPFKEWMARQLSGVYVCSDNGAQYLKDHNPLCAKQFHCGHLGTADCGVGPWDYPPQSMRPFTIVCCSRAVPLKRVNRVIDALAVLQRKGRPIQFFYIGVGPELDSLKQQADGLNLTGAFFMGSLPNADVLDFYRRQRVDLFVNVSTVEGIPVSVMEALSFGIPCLVTNVGGEHEIVNDGFGNGRLIDADFTDEELVLAIEEFMDSSFADMVNMRASARAVWEVCYSVRPNVEALLEELAGQWPKGKSS